MGYTFAVVTTYLSTPHAIKFAFLENEVFYLAILVLGFYEFIIYCVFMIGSTFSIKQYCFRGVIFTVWLILIGLLLERDVLISQLDMRQEMAMEKAEREEYQTIYFQNKKIGYVKNQYTPQADGTLAVRQQANMQLNISGAIHPIDLNLQALLDNTGRLQDFVFSFHSPFYKMKAQGKVQGNRVDFTLFTGKNEIKDSLLLNAPPMLSTSRRSYLLRKNLTVGSKVKIPWFDPLSLTGKETVIEYKGMEKTLIRDRIYNLHHFVENFSGSRINSWLNDDGDVIKEESPAGFVFIREPEFKALRAMEKSADLLAAVSIRIQGKMPDLTALKTIRYRLGLPDASDFALDGDRQSWDGETLTLHLESIPETSVMPHECQQQQQSLGATPYVQADHSQIRDLTNSLIADNPDHLDQVQIIGQWVFENLAKRPVLGIPDALTTLDTLQGDCNEHAALFAAMARSVGIPTRIIAGVVLHKEAFYYHAWNEVCLGKEWISLDTTRNQLPADLSHIRLLVGGIKEQMKIGSLLGKLSIAPLAESSERKN